MDEKRLILEMGSGSDLYGGDYNKAARRAIDDALRHSSISLFRTLGMSSDDMRVIVTIGVQEPEKLDCAALAAYLPRGKATVCAHKGGLNTPDVEDGRFHVTATAAIEVFLPDASGAWKLIDDEPSQ